LKNDITSNLEPPKPVIYSRNQAPRDDDLVSESCKFWA